MPQINQNIIEKVRQSSDILEVVGKYVNLKQKGNNYFGLCPFHNEKTGSFSVAPQKQIYHCFGCGSGGNVFSFLMNYQKISFPESVKMLAEQYNIPIKISENNRRPEIFTILQNLNSDAANLYQSNLFSDHGKEALKYLHDRGLSDTTIKKFQIGFAIDSWDQLVKYFNKKKIKKDYLIKAGLVSETKKGVFDRFRSRIMFPIFDLGGSIIAFGGRAFQNNDSAKYLNSPETLLYKKSRVFYGLNFTRNLIRKTEYAILVEGYTDFLQLYQAGFENAISVSGTALTEQHAKILFSLTKKVILLYDSDSAGANATIRAGWVLLRTGIDPLIVQPPENKDPDDWVKEDGREPLSLALKSPQQFIKFHISFFNAKNLQLTERRQYIYSISNELNSISDDIIRGDIIRTLSQSLLVDEKYFLKQSNYFKKQKLPNKSENIEAPNKLIFSSIEERAQVELIRVMAHSDQNNLESLKNNISIDYFTHPLLNKIVKYILKNKMDVESAKIISYFSDTNDHNSVAQVLFIDNEINEPEQIVTDCIKILKSRPIKDKIETLRVRIREKENTGQNSDAEIDEVTKLQNELNVL